MGNRSLRRQLVSDLRAAAPPPANPVFPPATIESPWADASQLESATWAGLLDQLDFLPVTRSQSIALPSVARGRDLIAISVARFQLSAMNAAGRLTNQPRICQQPEIGRSRFTTLVWTVDSLIFYGVAWWLITTRYADGWPRTARWVPPAAVRTDTTGQIETAWDEPVDLADVIRFDGPHEGFLSRGNDVVRAARRLAVSAARAGDNPVPSVELHQTAGDQLTDPEIASLIANWAAARRGENGGVAYTNQSIEARFHGAQAEQLLIDGRNAVRIDVAHQLGLPAWAVDAEVAGTSLTYSNAPSRSRELIDYTLAGYMESITGRLGLDDVLPAGTWAQFSTDVLTDGDFADRMRAGKDAVDAGIYTAAQIAAREAGQPMEGVTP